MKTKTRKSGGRRQLFLFAVIGYSIVVFFAALKLLTIVSDWWQEQRRQAWRPFV